MNQTSVKIYLSIFGESFDPNTLTSLVGLTPTKIGIKGQPIEGKAITYKDSFWDFSTDVTESLLLEEVTSSLVGTLKGLEHIIFQFMTAHALSAKFFIVIEIVNKQAPMSLPPLVCQFRLEFKPPVGTQQVS